uniref:Uncharacterized protein n=1 Tax=Pseudonaja textilis TaxID=8673 RepID=A0A670YX11_PSETE
FSHLLKHLKYLTIMRHYIHTYIHTYTHTPTRTYFPQNNTRSYFLLGPKIRTRAYFWMRLISPPPMYGRSLLLLVCGLEGGHMVCQCHLRCCCIDMKLFLLIF